jgi:stress response protein SCP2
MTRQLQKGENIILANLNSTANLNEIVVAMQWFKKVDNQETIEVNTSAFMLNESDKVTMPSDFIFASQPITTQQAILLKNQMFKVTLDKIPLAITRIPFALSIKQAERKNSFNSFKIITKFFNFQTKQELASYIIDDATIETALITVVLYRHQQKWKLKAVGQGYASGLETLAKNFGVDYLDNSIELAIQNKTPSLPNTLQLTNLTEKIIRDIAGETIFNRGKSYYQLNAVHQFNYDDKNHIIDAQVSGNYNNSYQLKITETHNNIHISCNCPYDGYPCKHGVAVLLKFLYNENIDESIIEVTGQGQKISYEAIPINDKRKVPFWQHQYIYSYSEINNASAEQIEFYHYFKICLLNDDYIDLGDNTNYAFVLMFDFLNEYKDHKNLEKLKKQLDLLGRYYPKTKTYCTKELEKVSNKINFISNSEELKNIISNYANDSYYSSSLGYQYKNKLNLTKKEVEILNKINYYKNVFSSIEYCFIEIIKIFLPTIDELNAVYLKEGTTLEQQLANIADVIARKEYRYRKGSGNYNECILSMTSALYVIIFKQCENILREHYQYNKKISIGNYRNQAVGIELNDKLLSKLNVIIATKLATINPPNTETEIQLNEINKSRWKIKFKELTDNFDSSTEWLFIEDVQKLATLNGNNPSLKTIFFEAFKFIKMTKESALVLYCYYLYYHYNSSTAPHKPLAKSEQKILFTTTQQQQDFEKIVSDLIIDKNINKALQSVYQLYTVNRKTIKLDRSAIERVHQQYANTVNLLNNYLQDDDEESLVIESTNINIPQGNSENSLGLNENQLDILKIFPLYNYSITHAEIEKISKEKGLFKNQLIDSINEACYEILDDILIEQDDDYYLINEHYYQRIFEVC